MEFADKELIAEFVIESQEGLAKVESQMLAIEAAGAEIDTDLVNAVFRTMHSIKGSAGFLGLDRIQTLAHSLEEVLNFLRNREIIPTSELVSTVLRAADFITGLIGSVETSNDADVGPFVAELQRFRPGAIPSEIVESKTPTTPVEPAVEVAPQPQLSKVVRDFLVECHDNLDEMDRNLLELEQSPASESLLRQVFRTMHTIKGGAGFLSLSGLQQLAHVAENLLAQLRDGKQSMTPAIAGILLSTTDKCREGLRLVETTGSEKGLESASLIAQLQGLIAGPPSSPGSPSAEQPRLGDILIAQGKVQPEVIDRAVQQQLEGDPLRLGEILVEQGVVKHQDLRQAVSTQQESRPSGSPDTSIRVDVGLLDKLMTRVGELVLARNQILQYVSSLEDSTFVRTAQRLNLITTELQESVMKTRMQPIGNVWSKFPRIVRDLASQLGKQVRIEMEGKETELDKTIIEAIKDPLTHIIRNAIDHGIESPEIRQAAGKTAEGLLFLRAYHEGGQVNIEITDDGAGLRIDRIRQKAVERGLVSAEQAARMSDREATQLVLLPGFSTAEKVTSVSGRGVGMDVVKTNIERIGGMIDLSSQLGKGTKIKLKIPLTLAIIPALVVTNDDDRYAIPQASLLELVRLEGENARSSIEFIHGAPVYRLRGKLLPLVNLSQRLALSDKPIIAAAGESAKNQAVNIVVLRANDRQFGLVVDKVNDTEEIVVKPLSRQLKQLEEYAGATIMGDGTVALILDVMGLAVAAGLAGEMREQMSGSTTEEAKSGDAMQSLLVVDLGDQRRFAMPTSMVSRLEKVPRSSIEIADGREVIQYRGAIMPLVRLAKVFGAAPRTGPEPDDLQIVVYGEERHSCGLVVNRIVDAVETDVRFHSQKGEDENLLGTAIIQQRVTDVVNLRSLARHATSAPLTLA